jgi:predicted aspartyl protease
MLCKAMIALVPMLAVQAAKAELPAEQRAFHAAEFGDVAPLADALPQLRNPSLAALAQIEIAASRMDEAGVQAGLTAYLSTQDPDAKRNARAWQLAAETSFARGDYAATAKKAERWRATLARSGDPSELSDADQLRALVGLLALVPPMQVVAAAGMEVPTRRDIAGLLRASAQIGGVEQSAVLDTGANLSTISASTAARLHLRMIEGAATVGSATRRAVPVRIAVADELRLGGFTFRNVPFLVLDDAQLRFPLGNGYSIEVIIGFPLFRAMGSVTFGQGLFTPGASVDAARSSPISMQGNNVLVSVQLGSEAVPLLLDTGGNATSLSAEYATEHPDRVAALPQTEQHVGGAGGISAQRIAMWSKAPVRIGGSEVVLDHLAIQLSKPGDAQGKTYGTIGQDLLSQFLAYTIDFRAMRFGVTPKSP